MEMETAAVKQHKPQVSLHELVAFVFSSWTLLTGQTADERFSCDEFPAVVIRLCLTHSISIADFAGVWSGMCRALQPARLSSKEGQQKP